MSRSTVALVIGIVLAAATTLVGGVVWSSRLGLVSLGIWGLSLALLLCSIVSLVVVIQQRNVALGLTRWHAVVLAEAARRLRIARERLDTNYLDMEAAPRDSTLQRQGHHRLRNQLVPKAVRLLHHAGPEVQGLLAIGEAQIAIALQEGAAELRDEVERSQQALRVTQTPASRR